jgi:hypothetical protein
MKTGEIFEDGDPGKLPQLDSYLVFSYVLEEGFERKEVRRFFASGKDKHEQVSACFLEKYPQKRIWKVVYE